MKDKIKLEIERLKQEQKPFDYSGEQQEIKSLEDKIQPLVERQMKKKPMFDEYQDRINILERTLDILNEFEDEEEQDTEIVPETDDELEEEIVYNEEKGEINQ